MFGSHLSVAGGLVNALHDAQRLGFDTVQVFTRNQRQWNVKPLDAAAADQWQTELRRLGWQGRTVAHNSYLVNMASPDAELREKSIATMLDELQRCERLGIAFLVFHPGAHVGEGVDAGLARLADAVARLLRETRGGTTVLCLENTAGGGSTLGRSFEELAHARALIDKAAGRDADGRIGFCIDTCHALAAGYDIAATDGPKGTGRKRTLVQGRALGDAMLAELDRAVGLDAVRVLHLNDSLGDRGSHIDRHAHIGHGRVALGAFAAIVNHPRLQAVPKILETPKEDDEKGRPWDTVNLAKLRRLITPGDPPKTSQVQIRQGIVTSKKRPAQRQ
jgi:deoxyribonuclease-4